MRIVGMDGVELFARKVHVFLRRRILGLRQGIAVKAFFKRADGCLQIAVLHNQAQEKPVAVGSRFDNKIPFGDITLIIWPNKQIFAAPTLVWPGNTNIGHIMEEGIVNRPQNRHSNIHYDRPILQIEFSQDIGCRSIGR